MTTTTEQIWKQFHKELLQFIMKRIPEKDIAKDILQDVFIKIHLKLHTLKQSEKLTSWVYQITRNSIIDYINSNKRWAELTDEVPDVTLPEQYNEEFAQCVRPMIRHLAPEYRDALLETDLGKTSQKDFAEKLGLSYSGAKSRIQRARMQLHEQFKQCCAVSADVYGNVLEMHKKNCTAC